MFIFFWKEEDDSVDLVPRFILFGDIGDDGGVGSGVRFLMTMSHCLNSSCICSVFLSTKVVMSGTCASACVKSQKDDHNLVGPGNAANGEIGSVGSATILLDKAAGGLYMLDGSVRGEPFVHSEIGLGFLPKNDILSSLCWVDFCFLFLVLLMRGSKARCWLASLLLWLQPIQSLQTWSVIVV